MSQPTIAIFSPGNMGSAIGRVLHDGGHEVVTCHAMPSAMWAKWKKLPPRAYPHHPQKNRAGIAGPFETDGFSPASMQG